MKISAKCEICGKTYIKTNGKSKYCSESCRREARRKQYSENQESRVAYQKKWLEDHPFYRQQWREDHPNYSRDYCREHRGSVERICECAVCGKKFSTYNKTARTCSKECSEIYRKKARAKRREKRKRMNGQYEQIDLKELFKRDKGVCHICGGVCDYNDFVLKDGAKVVGGNYPSIDHIVPLSIGGSHTWDNVGLAHMRCNARRGTKNA